jgi:hypothetical protein
VDEPLRYRGTTIVVSLDGGGLLCGTTTVVLGGVAACGTTTVDELGRGSTTVSFSYVLVTQAATNGRTASSRNIFLIAPSINVCRHSRIANPMP